MQTIPQINRAAVSPILNSLSILFSLIVPPSFSLVTVYKNESSGDPNFHFSTYFTDFYEFSDYSFLQRYLLSIARRHP